MARKARRKTARVARRGTRAVKMKWYSSWQTVPRTTLPVYAVHMRSHVHEPGEGFAAFTRWIVAPSVKVALAAARRHFDDAGVVSIHREDIRWGEGRYPTGRVKHVSTR